ncbi:FKBP-type peptidyl-prolyl cis-trans isomerase [Alloprevotella sp. OH1205_COT-284]|uniref:FKBP-type peptidyl-prolyl cis-trans isomerase n=1 Tax=Alloprevotella sp. OH1205_COT-284 TaxID=2491043 RepID=UPI000F5E1281|nr:FKBP-type peptidyl-prolyl cis-trans isomerase [Alloprevotella sp. OH1205_COT-284]RRD80732.1 FKBP-type peptidyl-prolyl cis-trans isomerase [Alloprevotella sp. OH1205_COT-284]
MNKLSYALGLIIGQNIKGMNIKELETADFMRAVDQVMSGERLEMTEVQAQGMVQEYLREQQEAAGKEAREAGENFLAENARKEGIVVTESGLQYQVLTSAIGQKPTAADRVRCHYEGRLIDGTVFDSSYRRGEPATFPLSGVIGGWTEGLQLMAVGAKYRFFIPYNLAYGAQGAGGSIPPYAALVFDVELLGINE